MRAWPFADQAMGAQHPEFAAYGGGTATSFLVRFQRGGTDDRLWSSVIQPAIRKAIVVFAGMTDH